MKAVRKNKRGVTLAIVMVIAMALLIFSSALFAAASHNLDLTGRSVDGRQAYLTAKSAIEYAKTVVYRQAKSGSLQSFSVKPGAADGLFAEGAAGGPPDGVSVLAACTVSGEDVKISAKVKNKNSDGYQKLDYRFTVVFHPATGLSPFDSINNYVAAGQRYGNYWFLNSGNVLSGADSKYPAAFQPEISTNQPFAAPEMYFLNKGTSFQMQGGGTFSCTLDSNVIYFNGAVRSGGNAPDSVQNLKLENSKFDTLNLHNGFAGIVWFYNTTIYYKDRSYRVEDGPYYFRAGTDLFDFGSFQTNLVQVGDGDFDSVPALKAIRLKQKIAYYQTNNGKIQSSEGEGGVGWTSQGKMNSNPAPQPESDVFIYTDKNTYHGDWQKGFTATYAARNISLFYLGEQDSPFTVPQNGSVTFQAATFWLNGQSEDGSPTDDRDDDDVPTLKASSGSHFILASPDGSDMKLLLPHGLVVEGNNGTYRIDTKSFPGYNPNDPSTFAFTVKSGTDLFSLRTSTFQNSIRQITGVSGGGSGGTGGFTVSGGVYSKS